MKHKQAAVAMLNAILLLSVTASLLGLVMKSYQQQVRSYTRLTHYYQAKSLANLTQAVSQNQQIQGLQTTLGTTQIDDKANQITVQLKHGPKKQFKITSRTDIK